MKQKQLILNKNKNNHHKAIDDVAFLIENLLQLDRKGMFLKLDNLGEMLPERKSLLVITEFLNKESWDGIDEAAFFYSEIVLEVIEEKLQLPQLANDLKKIKGNEQFDWKNNNELLVKSIHEFIEKNIEKFP